MIKVHIKWLAYVLRIKIKPFGYYFLGPPKNINDNFQLSLKLKGRWESVDIPRGSVLLPGILMANPISELENHN